VIIILFLYEHFLYRNYAFCRLSPYSNTFLECQWFYISWTFTSLGRGAAWNAILFYFSRIIHRMTMKVNYIDRIEFTLFELFSLFEFSEPVWHLHSIFVKFLMHRFKRTNIESSYLDIWFSISKSTFHQIIYYLSMQ